METIQIVSALAVFGFGALTGAAAALQYAARREDALETRIKYLRSEREHAEGVVKALGEVVANYRDRVERLEGRP